MSTTSILSAALVSLPPKRASARAHAELETAACYAALSDDSSTEEEEELDLSGSSGDEEDQVAQEGIPNKGTPQLRPRLSLRRGGPEPAAEPSAAPAAGRGQLVRRKSSGVFRPEVERLLASRGTPLLNSIRGWALQAFVLLVFVSIAAHDGLAKTWSKAGQPTFPYRISSVVLVVKLATVTLAGSAAFCAQGAFGLKSVMRPRALVSCVMPSGLLCAAQLLHYSALAELSAEEVAIAEKGQLVLVAILSSGILGRRYSPQQWVALLAVTIFTAAFVQMQRGASATAHAAHSDEVDVDDMLGSRRQGWLLMLASLLIGCLAGILMEQLFKQGADELYVVQKARMALPGAALALVVSLHSGQACAGEFWSGWDGRAIVVVLLMLAKAWLTSFMVKLLSSVALALASTMAMLVTFAEARLIFSSRGMRLSEAAIVCCIAGATGWFAAESVGAKKAAKSRRNSLGSSPRSPTHASTRIAELKQPLLAKQARLD